MARRRSSGGNNRSLIDLVSYIGIILIGVALFISMLSAVGVTFLNGVAGTCNHIAQIISYAILLWNSYYYAIQRGKKHPLFICWIICVVLIVVSYFFGNFWANVVALFKK